MGALHLVTCEYPPVMGGVSEHSRVLAEAAVAEGYDVDVWTGTSGTASKAFTFDPSWATSRARRSPRGYRPERVRAAAAARGPVGAAWLRTPGPERRLQPMAAPSARAGDRIDLIVHEPFMDFFGASWRQPAAALVQRYMTWMAVRAAERVWLTIPAWEPRLRIARRRGQPAPRTLPVPGTIPPVRDAASVAALRGALLRGRSRLVGYFGAGNRYATDAIRSTVAELGTRQVDAALVCFGRGSDTLAADVEGAAPGIVPVTGTGALALDRLSLHLQACDVMLQPYSDGVSGRRTTTVSALEHAVPVATTLGFLSEPFWSETRAVEAVPAEAPDTLPSALLELLDPARNRAARTSAAALYRERFDPVAWTFKALFQCA